MSLVPGQDNVEFRWKLSIIARVKVTNFILIAMPSSNTVIKYSKTYTKTQTITVTPDPHAVFSVSMVYQNKNDFGW